MKKSIALVVGPVEVPAWVVDHPSFLRWLRSGVVPEEVRISYINDQLWVEVMPERGFSHNKVKTLVARVLDGLVEEFELGLYFGDGMTYTCEEEQFTTVPDGIFLSRETIDTQRAILRGGKRGSQDTEVLGIPDLVIEVVSPSSVDKDTEWLIAKYWAARIPEYWLIDARSDVIRFTINRRGAKGYSAVRKVEGWTRSIALGRSFRFSEARRELGHAIYRFEVR